MTVYQAVSCAFLDCGMSGLVWWVKNQDKPGWFVQGWVVNYVSVSGVEFWPMPHSHIQQPHRTGLLPTSQIQGDPRVNWLRSKITHFHPVCLVGIILHDMEQPKSERGHQKTEHSWTLRSTTAPADHDHALLQPLQTLVRPFLDDVFQFPQAVSLKNWCKKPAKNL
jgi:hypothetical protein